MEEDKNKDLIDVNDTQESAQLKNENEQKEKKNLTCLEKCVKNFKSTGGEVWFALTFLGRVVMTIYSFHGLFFIYNFVIQFIILIPGRLYDLDSVVIQVIFGLLYILFASATSNVLVIPTYELLLFPFLNFRNPLAHLHSLVRVKYVIDNDRKKLEKDGKEEDIEHKNLLIMNILLILVGFIYLIGLFISLLFSTYIKDYTKMLILFCIYTHYILLFAGYVLISIYLCAKCIAFSYKKNNGCWNIFMHAMNINEYFGDPEKKKLKINNDDNKEDGKDINKNSKDNNEEERDLPPLPRINLLSYVIHPVLMKSYRFEHRNELKNNTEKRNLEDYIMFFKNLFRVILFLYALFLVIFDIVVKSKKVEASSIILFLIFFLMMLLLSSVLNFPVCCRNKKTFNVGGFFTGKVKYKPEYKMRHPNMVTFIRFLCKCLVTLCAIILFAVFYVFKESDSLKDLYNVSLKAKKRNVDSHSLLLPNVCFSSIHYIPIYLFMPFINDAYYYNDKHGDYEHYYDSSLQIPTYVDFFYDSDYRIDKIKSLINGTEGESVKMIQYNVFKKAERDTEITILAIKGTTNKKDAFIDFQLYFPSILLNLLSTFSLQGQQKETLSFKFIEYSLSVPYRIFFQYSLIQSYLNDLKKAYLDNYDSFYKNIIIVGHSLGGGLAKLLGRILNKQAISLSGPGVNAFHSLWGYGGNSENFEISAIDLVPDMDLVPRVEVSGGTIYRIICKSGPFACHSKALSLCEVLIMCRNPNYYSYCSEIAGISDEEIKELYDSSEMNYNIVK